MKILPCIAMRVLRIACGIVAATEILPDLGMPVGYMVKATLLRCLRLLIGGERWYVSQISTDK